MIWFDGSIADAVKTSKLQNAIFVVFVEGSDANSKTMREMIDRASTKLNSTNFVAVKLEAGSESYNQFVQIYQLVPVPSLFFIGKNGTPIEVIPQGMEDGKFIAKIDAIVAKSGYILSAGQGKAQTSDDFIKSEAQGSTPKASTSKPTTPTDPPKPLEPTVIINKITAETVKDPIEELSIEEKSERAKQIIEENREAKRLEEEETQRKKEIERRKMGQEIQKMRRQQQDQEMKQIREEILREKNEELAARQKILQQIEQDKEDRAKKFNASVPEPSPVAADTEVLTQRVIPTRDVNVARLQFRLADGSSHTHDFPATNTLQDIRTYVQSAMNLPYRQFDLSTTFPRRQFTAVDNGRTLIDLELIPNAVILVVPVTNTAVTRSSPTGNMLSGLLWFFLTPVYGAFGYIRDYFNNWRNPRPHPYKRPNEAGPSQRTANGPSQPNRRMPDSTVIKRQGTSNVHRLTDRKDDNSDDDNNTWNGNSTQQM